MEATVFVSRPELRHLEAEALGGVHVDLDDVMERPFVDDLDAVEAAA